MACLQMNRACKVCGKFHDFFLCQGELVTDQRYEYRCPETGQTEYLWDIPRVEAVSEPPPGGVELRPTGVESGRRGGMG
jgi:hypothetical protein